MYIQHRVVDEFFDGFDFVLLPATLEIQQNIFGGDGRKLIEEATLRYAQIQCNYLKSKRNINERNKTKFKMAPSNGSILATCAFDEKTETKGKNDSSEAEIWRRRTWLTHGTHKHR